MEVIAVQVIFRWSGSADRASNGPIQLQSQRRSTYRHPIFSAL